MRYPLVLVGLILLLASCNRHSGGTATTGNPAKLPAGWPEAALTLPGDAVEHALPYYKQIDLGDGKYGVRSVFPAGGGDTWDAPEGGSDIGEWEQAFTSGLSWTELVGHAESGILAAGYTKLFDRQGSSSSRTFNASIYLSSDRMTIVMVRSEELELDDGSGTSAAYMYQVVRMPVPAPQDRIDKLVAKYAS